MLNPYFFGVSGMANNSGVGAQAQHAENRAERAVGGVQQLSDRIDRLVLVNMALWSLVEEKLGLTEQDLMDRVQQIDLADGQEDGKASKPPAKCPECGRIMSPRHKRCMYCGADRLDYTAFDSAR